HRTGSRALPSLLRVTRSATSEHLAGLLGSSPIPKSLVASCVRLQLRPLSSTGITRLPRSYGPLRHPSRPSLTLTSRRLIQLRSPLGFPVLPLVPCLHAVATTPAGPMDLFARAVPSAAAFPGNVTGRLPR